MARKKKEEVKTENPHTGSTFDSFLQEEGIAEEVAENVAKKSLEVPKAAPIEYKHYALGVAKNETTGLWYLIQIPYNLNDVINLEKNAVGTIIIREQGDMRSIINERFVLAASRELDVST